MHFAGTALTSSREWGEAPAAAAAGAHTGLSATGGPTTIILLLDHLLCPRLVVASPNHAAVLEMELPILQWLSSPGLSPHMRCQRAGEYPGLGEAACRYGPLFLILVLLTFGKVS